MSTERLAAVPPIPDAMMDAAALQLSGHEGNLRFVLEAAFAAAPPEWFISPRVAELEAELAEERKAGDLRMEKLAELETARHHTSTYWAKREKELEAEVEDAVARAEHLRDELESWRQRGIRAEAFREQYDLMAARSLEQHRRLAEERENSAAHLSLVEKLGSKLAEVEKERDQLQYAVGLGGPLAIPLASIERARELAENARIDPEAHDTWLLADELARLLSGKAEKP